MRDIFPEYYRPDEAQLKTIWQECLFVLDASVVLALYRLPQEGREDLFKTLGALKERLWMPYHAALEYQRNRLKVIADQKSLLPDLRKKVSSTLTDLKNEFPKHPAIDPDEVLAPVFKALEDCNTKLADMEAQRADVHEADLVRDQIDELMKGSVGARPSQQDVDAIDKEGERRFAESIAPGFKDIGKTGTYLAQDIRYQGKFGDLYVWKQTLAHISKEKITSIVLITNDVKEDWWLRIKGKSLGPLPELVAECIASGAKSFHMYTLAQFLEHAGHFLNNHVREEAIEQAAELEMPSKKPVKLFPIAEIIFEEGALDDSAIKTLETLAFMNLGAETRARRTGPRHAMLYSAEPPDPMEWERFTNYIFSNMKAASVHPMLHLTPSRSAFRPRTRCIRVDFEPADIASVTRLIVGSTERYFPSARSPEWHPTSALIYIPVEAEQSTVNTYVAQLRSAPYIQDVRQIA